MIPLRRPRPFSLSARRARTPSAFALAALVLGSTGCWLKRHKDAPDASAIAEPPAPIDTAPTSASASTTIAQVIPNAVNAKEIARFGDEQPTEPTPDKVESTTTANKGPTSTEQITTLKKGAAVTSFAKRGDFVLVTFANPKEPAEQLAGWIPASALSPPKTATSAASASGSAGKRGIGPLKVGDKLRVEWHGSVWDATVIALAGKGAKVHYDGFGPEWDEVVGPDRIAARR